LEKIEDFEITQEAIRDNFKKKIDERKKEIEEREKLSVIEDETRDERNKRKQEKYC